MSRLTVDVPSQDVGDRLLRALDYLSKVGSEQSARSMYLRFADVVDAGEGPYEFGFRSSGERRTFETAVETYLEEQPVEEQEERALARYASLDAATDDPDW